jgi:hypothetical protein
MYFVLSILTMDRKSKMKKDQELVTHNDQSSQPTNSTQSSTESHDNIKV